MPSKTPSYLSNNDKKVLDDMLKSSNYLTKEIITIKRIFKQNK